jgi:DNA mismatch repair protein MutS
MVLAETPPDAEKGDPAPSKTAAVTPMMAQYLGIKNDYPEYLLFYRMGDFYELFFDDAVKAAAALNITLTKRGKHDGADIPMCGVPVHAADTYLSRLIRQKFKVAVCEQTEDPAEAKKRGGKSVVARDVVRLVTPGTLTEETLLDARQHNYLAALARTGTDLALAWLDLSTGEFLVQALDRRHLEPDLARLDPGELLVPDAMLGDDAMAAALRDWQDVTTPLPRGATDSAATARRLAKHYGVAALDAFGDFARAEVAALGTVFDYVDLTQRGKLPVLRPPASVKTAHLLSIDAATRRNLELTRTLSGEREGSLLAVIDRTVTGAGARLLADRLAAPATDPAVVGDRLDLVQFFVEDAPRREDLRALLNEAPDVARAIARLSLGRGGPRDLAAVRDGLSAAEKARRLLAPNDPPAPLSALTAPLDGHDDLVATLAAALGDELPHLARDGGFIAKGYDAALDELRTLRDESRRHTAALQARYAEETGINGLKIKHNNVLGYFIEVTPTHADKMAKDLPEDIRAPFIHRQTLASAVRYTTTELGELEGKISSAADRALAIEQSLFDKLAAQTLARADGIGAAAAALAALDVAAALADLAVARHYVRPQVDDSRTFQIVGGRHPVVEDAQQRANDPAFVANDCDLGDDGAVWLVTGPNMAGKSTFLRQNALIVILAQMGSYVPATSAHIGIVDRLFSRVGAADDLARGRSTFMVEMVETAAILNRATDRSLVILDEIGRGTATFDGLSIAWAAIEHLHDVNLCRSLFATHYHELTVLAHKLPRLSTHAMRIKEWKGDIVFLHEAVAGAADRSYGIAVAKLAGLPPPVIRRANEILKALEASEQGSAVARLADDLPLFAATMSDAEEEGAADAPSALAAALAAIVPDDLTPREALEALYRLKALSRDS